VRAEDATIVGNALVAAEIIRPQQWSRADAALPLNEMLAKFAQLPAWWNPEEPTLNDFQIDQIKRQSASRFRDLDRKLCFNRYLRRRFLGSGGMAKVYLCWSLEHRNYVAVKHLKQFDSQLHTRFENEARIMKSLQHANIAQFIAYEANRLEENSHFLVMEYVSGRPLKDYIKDARNSLPFDFVSRIGTQVADALQYAHDHEVIHRDITAGNVMINHLNDARLVDFGLAKQDDSGTMTAAAIGTAAYMSPEQFGDAKNVTPSADIYSFGCVLYEMLTTETPFKGDLVQQCAQHCNNTPKAPRTLNPNIPRHWNDLILGTLEKSPANRPRLSEIKQTIASNQPVAVPVEVPQFTASSIETPRETQTAESDVRPGSAHHHKVYLPSELLHPARRSACAKFVPVSQFAEASRFIDPVPHSLSELIGGVLFGNFVSILAVLIAVAVFARLYLI